jgi:hypothetical protein
MSEPKIRVSDVGRPIRETRIPVGLPGVNCPSCGQIWAVTGNRIRKELPGNHPLRSVSLRPVSPQDLQTMIQGVRASIELNGQEWFPPGTNIGLLSLELYDPETSSFEWPGIASVLIEDSIKDVMHREGLTGWTTAPVIFAQRPHGMRVPHVSEFVVTGKAGMVVTDPPLKVASVCSLCNRVERNKVDCFKASINIKAWDGSDFCHFDFPCYIPIIVSERAVQVLQDYEATNIEFIPIETVEQ